MTCPPTFSATTNMRSGTISASRRRLATPRDLDSGESRWRPGSRLLLLLLGLLPERFEFLHRNLFGSDAAFVQPLFHPLKPPAELAIRFAQRGFRIEREIAGDVDQHKEKIADFLFQPHPQIFGNALAAGTCHAAAFGARTGSGKFPQMLAQFGGLLGEFLEQTLHVRPVETDLRRARAELVSLQ